jgi:hypothetical protein
MPVIEWRQAEICVAPTGQVRDIDILPMAKARRFQASVIWRFTFLFPDRLGSRVPYRVQGHAICPVRWSLKNQRTAPALPIANIHRGIGITVCVVATTGTYKGVLLAMPKGTAVMAAFARIGRRHLLDNDTGKCGFVGDELLQLEEWPIVPVLSSVSFCGLALPGMGADTRQVFQPNAGLTALRQRDNVFGEAMVNMRHNPPFTTRKPLDGPVLPSRLQLLPACRIDAADMTDTRSFPEDDWTIRRCSSHRDVLPPINPNPAACQLSIGNLHRHRETGIPDAHAGPPELAGARGGTALKESVQPALVCGMMHSQWDTLRDATAKSEGNGVRVAHVMQRPVLVVRLQRQTSKLLHPRAGSGIADGLIDPGRANLDMGKRLAGQCAMFAFRHGKDGVGGRGIEPLQAGELLRFRTIEAQKWQFESLGCSAHMSKYVQSCGALQDNTVPAGAGNLLISPCLKAEALRRSW